MEGLIMNRFRILALLALVGLVAVGCSDSDPVTSPDTPQAADAKDGNEALGEIAIAAGSGFVTGGVGMVGQETGMLEFTVPEGAVINQVLLYWVGGATVDVGDDMITVDGNEVTGTLIGGPTNFYQEMDFYAYRADVTAEGWVMPGANSFEISGFDFDFSGNIHDENDGAGMVVIYDDGSTSELKFFDGLDLAFFQFAPPLDATEPITFEFAAEPVERTAQFVVLAGSVGENRPNRIVVSTSAGDQVFDDLLGGTDGPLFDEISLDVTIPAGDTSLMARMISVESFDPLGASLAWIGSGLAVPTTPPPPLFCIGDRVWYDANGDGCQDDGEMGAAGVEVNLWMGCPPVEVIATTTTDADGLYEFCGLEPGDYTVQFVAPEGYEFCQPSSSVCGPELDSNAGPDGISDCVTIVDADDRTIDAGLCMIPQDGCTHTIGYWRNHLEVVEPLLPIWLGDADGEASIAVTDTDIAYEILTRAWDSSRNMIIKLYAQLLATKLSIADGADPTAVLDAIAEADAWLAMYDWTDWDDIPRPERGMIGDWKDIFDMYNNGEIGPGHCD
jgi:hypothetical protein